MQALVALGARLGVPTALRSVGVRERDLPEAARRVADGARAKLPADGPLAVDEQQVAALVAAAFHGPPGGAG